MQASGFYFFKHCFLSIQPAPEGASFLNMKSSLQSAIRPALNGPNAVPKFLLVIAAVFSGCNLLNLLFWYHPDSLPMGATGGVWTALAYDFSQGIFYRPVFDDFGYGGTRYLFLFFTLHGILIRIFHDPVLTGFSLVLISALALNAGIFFLLRQLKLQALESAAFSILTTVCISYQLLTLEIMGEFLSCALNVFGMVFAIRHFKKGSSSTLILSVLCFSASFLTKFSSIAGLTAVCYYFFLHRQSRVAFRLLAGTAVVILTSLAIAYWTSDGRILSSFMAFADGPANWNYFYKFPFWFAMLLLRDPFFLLIFSFALLLICKDESPVRESFPKIYFFISLGMTLFIFTSPGTDYNHLLDLIVASILVLGTQFQNKLYPQKIWNGLFGLLSIGLVFTWLPGTISIQKFMEAHGGKPTRHVVEQLIQKIDAGSTRVLSENPLIPILMNQRPIVLDAFALRRLSLTHPEVLSDFNDKLKSHYFNAIILMDFSGDPEPKIFNALESHTSPGVERFYGGVHFPADFLGLLKENYLLGEVMKPFVLFFPKK
jgi:hypothetical protein